MPWLDSTGLDATGLALQAAFAASDGGELPPQLGAIQRPLCALAYQMAGHDLFKTHFNRLVYEALLAYTDAQEAGYAPPELPGAAAEML